MNMCGIFAFFAAVFLAMVAALPTLDDVEVHDWQLNIKEESELEPALKDEPEEIGVRLARATCDLLSFSTPIGSLGHSACAAHCLAMRRGFRGGRCRDGVCHCRR